MSQSLEIYNRSEHNNKNKLFIGLNLIVFSCMIIINVVWSYVSPSY